MCILFSMCLFACHLCISISLSHSLYVYVCISLYLNSVYRHTYGLHPVPAYLGICLHVSLPVCPYVYLYVWQSICPSASISSSLYYCAPCPLVPLSLCLLLSGPQTAEYFVIMSGERFPPPRFKSVLPECKRDSSLPFQTLLLPSAVCIYAVELSERLSVERLSRKRHTWCSGQDTSIRGQFCFSGLQAYCCIYCVNLTLCSGLPHIFPSVILTVHPNLNLTYRITKSNTYILRNPNLAASEAGHLGLSQHSFPYPLQTNLQIFLVHLPICHSSLHVLPAEHLSGRCELLYFNTLLCPRQISRYVSSF
jgi:hypothetical protein